MRSRRDPIRAALAAGLSMLMLTLSVAVPVLEQGSLFHHPVAESAHNPGECPSGHDHTICTQVGANLAIDTNDVDGPQAPSAVSLSAVEGHRALPTRTLGRANPSRAPPLA